MNTHIKRELTWHADAMQLDFGELFPHEKAAQCYGPFGYWVDGDLYVVTHLATGLKVCPFADEAKARTLIERLTAMGDWESEDASSFQRYRIYLVDMIASIDRRYAVVTGVDGCVRLREARQ
jgi:hypothetical protein